MDKVNKILEFISKKGLVSKYSAVPNTDDRRPGFALKASPRQAEDKGWMQRADT